jgi:N-methylhydantoinase B
MPSKFTVDLFPGDEVVIETPGGGGWGSRATG